MVMKKLGVRRPFLIEMAQATVDADLFTAANTVPAGYQMELVAHHVMVRRLMGQNTGAMREAAKHIAKKQPLNPLFLWLHDGPTEEAAQLALQTCADHMGYKSGDIFFQRRLERNAQGEIVVIRDWHEPVPLPAKEIASGHDCMIVLSALLH
jgi:hypothetical protein